jgi:hypothetical protein
MKRSNVGMRDLLTLVALIVSSAGVIVSLTREEVRCYLGLPSTACQTSSREASPRLENREPEKVTDSPSLPTNLANPLPSSEVDNQTSRSLQVPPTEPPASTAVSVPSSQPESGSGSEETQTHSIPLEVIPPPSEATDNSQQTLNDSPSSP